MPDTPRTDALHDRIAPQNGPVYCYDEMINHARILERKLAEANRRLEFYGAADQILCELREENNRLKRELAEATVKGRERCIKAVMSEPDHATPEVENFVAYAVNRAKRNIINRIKQEAGEVGRG